MTFIELLYAGVWDDGSRGKMNGERVMTKRREAHIIVLTVMRTDQVASTRTHGSSRVYSCAQAMTREFMRLGHSACLQHSRAINSIDVIAAYLQVGCKYVIIRSN